MRLLETIYLILPLLVAGAAHAPVIKKDVLPVLARPLDMGRTFRGDPLFGENKTWRGLILMSAVSVSVVFAQSQLYSFGAFRSISIVDYSRTSWVALGLALGLSYSLAELPNSFVKRRFGIPPGGISRRGVVFQYVVDQADSAIGGTFVLVFFIGVHVGTLLLVFAVGFTLHVVMDRLFFLFSVKGQPGLVRARLKGQPSC